MLAIWSLDSFSFSETSLDNCKFMVVEACLENFEHYFTSIWDQCHCAVVWAFFGIAFLWDWNENWPFLVLWPLLSFCWHVECSTFTASSFRIWNSSTGISPPPLALFLRPTWLCIPGCLDLGEWSHHHDYLGHEDLFCTVLCILATSSFLKKIYFILLYNTVLVLPYINMNPPRVYTCSQSWAPLPPPYPYHLSGSSQCTSPKHPVSCIEPWLVIRFLYDIIHVSMPFS